MMFKFFHNKPRVGKLPIIVAVLVLLLALAGFVMLLLPSIKQLKNSIKNRLELTVLLPDDCADCFDIHQVTDFLKNDFKISFTKEKEYKASDKQAQKLIADNGITNLPTFILTGAVKDLALEEKLATESIAKNEEKLFVYQNIFPPYLDLKEGNVKGYFDLLFLTDQSCVECYDVELHKTAFENLIMKPKASYYIDVSSDEGKALVEKYQIKYEPTILIQGDMDVYFTFKNLWKTVGTIEEDGTYIFREDGLKLMGVYKDLKTGKLQGEQNL